MAAKVKVKSLTHVRLFATTWNVAYQTPPSMGFSRQEYWSGLPFPSPGDLPDPGIKPWSPALQVDVSPSEPPGKPEYCPWWDIFSSFIPTFLIFISLSICGILNSFLNMNDLCITNILLVWGLPFHSFGDFFFFFDKQKFLLLMEYSLLTFYLICSAVYVLFKKCLHTLCL